MLCLPVDDESPLKLARGEPEREMRLCVQLELRVHSGKEGRGGEGRGGEGRDIHIFGNYLRVNASFTSNMHTSLHVYDKRDQYKQQRYRLISCVF